MTPEADTEAKELARHLMIAAARFAASAMDAYAQSYPREVELLAQGGGSWGVRVTDILSVHPRVSLVSVIGGKDQEIAHVLLQTPGVLDRAKMN